MVPIGPILLCFLGSLEYERCGQAYALPMRYIFVPQTGHVPWVAGRPFFRVTFCGFRISLLARHFRQ